MTAPVRTVLGLPSLHASSKMSRQVMRSAQPGGREPKVFRPASQTCPPERFMSVNKYENPFKKELPVGHWNSQYLDDPDEWWGDSDTVDFSFGSSGGSGGPGGRGSSGWGSDDFEDDDDYDLSAFPLGILVLGLGAVSSGLASGCIVYESTVLAAEAVSGPPRLPSSLYLPVSKRMLWFRKHGNAKMAVGFAANAWIWLLVGLASAATAFIKRRSRQPGTDQELPQPLPIEEPDIEKMLADEDSQQSVNVQPEASDGETLAPVSAATDSDELCSASITTEEMARLPDAVEPRAAVLEEQETNNDHTDEPSTEEPCATAKAESEAGYGAKTNDLRTEAVVQRSEVSIETPRSAREQLNSARCHPGARFWKHKSFSPSGSRSVQALGVEGDDLDNLTYNSAQNFWKQQTAAVQAASTETPAALLDMSVEAVAARLRAARSCCFATNQRPQVPRLRGIPPGPLGPNTPDNSATSATTSKQQNDSERSLVSERQQTYETWLQSQGTAAELSRRQRTISDSSASSRGSLRKAFSANYRPSSIMNSNRTLPSPSTPELTDDVHKPRARIRGLDTIQSCAEADSGALTTSSMDSEWTLSADNAVYDEGTSSDGMSECDTPTESEVSEDGTAPVAQAATAPLPNVPFNAIDDSEDLAARDELLQLTHASSQPLQDTDNSRAHAHLADASDDMFSDTDSLDSVENASTYAYDGPCNEQDGDRRSPATSVRAEDLSAPLKSQFEEDREISGPTSCSKRLSEGSNASSTQHSQQSQHSLSLSAEALVFETNEDQGNNPLFWEDHNQQPLEVGGAPAQGSACDGSSSNLFRRLSGGRPSPRSGDDRAPVRMSTRYSLPEQEMESLDLVQASASCMLEQQVHCLVGTRYVNPLPLLTVNRSPSQSPEPTAREDRDYGLTTPGSPGASSRSSGASMNSVLADALRSAQRSMANTGSPQQAVLPAADAHEHIGRLSCEEPCPGWHEQRIQQIDLAEKSDAENAEELQELVSDAADEPGSGTRVRRHIFSLVETLHARSRPASPDNSRARTACELHTGASLFQRSYQEGEVGSEVAVGDRCQIGQRSSGDFAGPRPVSDRRSGSTQSDSSGTPNFFAYPSHVE